jgi:predicted lipid-binding transport protein (Tim44 family)
MGNSFQFIDIIFFAMIAIFLILRLRGALGKRDGKEGSGFQDLFKQGPAEGESEQENEEKNVVNLSKKSIKSEASENARANDNEADTILKEMQDESPLASGYAELRRNDTNFNDEDFTVGVRVAFEMILKAYTSADVDGLKILLSNEVYGNFAKAIQDREQAGHVMEDTLVRIMESEIEEVYMEGRNAHVTVKFVSEQVNVTRDENGDVVEGDPNAVLTVTDFWTFARDTKNTDPNWFLIATRSLD